jgi:hypothetical protein
MIEQRANTAAAQVMIARAHEWAVKSLRAVIALRQAAITSIVLLIVIMCRITPREPGASFFSSGLLYYRLRGLRLVFNEETAVINAATPMRNVPNPSRIYGSKARKIKYYSSLVSP